MKVWTIIFIICTIYVAIKWWAERIKFKALLYYSLIKDTPLQQKKNWNGA